MIRFVTAAGKELSTDEVHRLLREWSHGSVQMIEDDSAIVVPADRTITGNSNQSLKVLPGETMLFANCCERCGHIQRGRIECLAE